MKYLKIFFKNYLLFYFIFSVCLVFISMFGFPVFLHLSSLLAFAFAYFILIYFVFRRFLKPNQETLIFHIISTILIFIIFSLCLYFSQGIITSKIWIPLYIIFAPFLPFIFLSQFAGIFFKAFLGILIILCMNILFCFVILKPQINYKKAMILILSIVLLTTFDYHIYINSPSQKYKGHHFEYMNGYSSTDLSPFLPYASPSQLITLKEPSTFTIEEERNMPILDGAETCYPVYSAIAKAVYKDIDQIELRNTNNYNYVNGKVVSFTNTSIGYSRLINGEIDMFFGAKPSASQIEEAKQQGVEFEYTPIGKEAFVFFVNKDNPIDSLTSQQIKDIYHGTITNWNQVGGKDQDIIAFQRPERSGSQSMMNYFMGDVSLKEPLTYEMISGMEGIIKEVAEYHNEDGAIGYTFKYFLEGLNQEKNVKILKVDDVYPTSENIKNQTYPISTYLYCVTLKSNKKENVKKLKEYLLSDQGQYIIEKTGYCALKN